MPLPLDLNFDDEMHVKIGDKTYRLGLDFSSVLHSRIQRWFASQSEDAVDEAAVEQTGIDLTASALKVERTVAAGFKPMQRKHLLAFLSVGPYPSSEATPAT
jgi:hypothetical protein